MQGTLGSSAGTFGGLVKHLALVEDHYFAHQLLGRDYPRWASLALLDQETSSSAASTIARMSLLWVQVRADRTAPTVAPAWAKASSSVRFG